MAWELVETLTDAAHYVYCVFADENYLYVGSHDRNAYIYDKTDFSLVEVLPNGAIYSVYADENYLYSAILTEIHIYDKTDFSLVETLADPGQAVYSVYADENYLYAGAYGTSKYSKVYIYNKTDFSLVETLDKPYISVNSVYADSNYLYAGGYDSLYVYSKTDFSLVETLADNADNMAIYSVYADENYLYANTGTGLYIYDKTDFSLIKTETGGGKSVYADENYLYANTGTKICVYNKVDFSLNATLEEATGTVYSVYADEKYLYAGSYDNNVYIYQLPVSYQYAYGDILSAATATTITVDSFVNLLTTSAMKVNTQQILVTSSFSSVYSEAENTKEFRIATSNLKNIRSGIGGHREVNSHIESINSHSPDPEYAKQVRSEMSKIRSSTYIKRTRAVSSNINTLQSSAKKHYDRNASTVTAIFSSAEIGPVTKTGISYVNINSKIAKLAKTTANPSFLKKIITEAITSSVTPKGLERLPHNYNKSPGSNNWKLITIIQDEITRINQKAENISKMQNIDDAFGMYLDRHGENLQLKRGNKTDPIYRIALKAKLQRNISRGSVNEIIEIIATMLNIERSGVRIEENPGDEPAAMYIEVPIAPLAKFGLSYDTFADIVDGVMAGGITLYSLTQGTYTYGDIDYEYNEEQGLADATDPDRVIGGYFGAWAERGL